MSVLRILLVLLLARAAVAATPCEDFVCLETERTPAGVAFHANSRVDGVTVHFSVSMSTEQMPLAVMKAVSRGRTELLAVPFPKGKEPTLTPNFFWEWGVMGAEHDDRVSYRLPYPRGTEFFLGQGPDGKTTHAGRVAFDFSMPRGTPVCAARAGTVTLVVDGFDEGRPEEEFADKANAVQILHADGTFADYAHLTRGTIRVKQGDLVEAGAVLALSGNSGWSAGPHLHFEVWRRMDEAPLQSLPVKFTVGGREGVVLQPGKSYRAD